jgi:hypothetical protein
MSAPLDSEWQQANRRALSDALGRVRAALEHQADPSKSPASGPTPAPGVEAAAPSALDTLVELFGLTSFERDVLVLCAGLELEGDFAPLCAAAQRDPNFNFPTYSLALAALPDPDWTAISPERPLRAWNLVELEPGRSLVYCPLKVDERILFYLMGVPGLDRHLAGLVRPLSPASNLPPSYIALARELATTWIQPGGGAELPVLQLFGGSPESQHNVAALTCDLLDNSAYILSASAIPVDGHEFDRFIRTWQREVLLSDRILLLDCDEESEGDGRVQHVRSFFSDNLGAPLITCSRDRFAISRLALQYEVGKPERAEQLAIWQAELGDRAAGLDAQLERLVTNFNLYPQAIRAACLQERGQHALEMQADKPDAAAQGEALWQVCRAQARPQLDDLAQRITPVASWPDLVLPQAQLEILRQIGMHQRQRRQVYDTWNFVSKGQRGLGITALFSGPSGAGKTMAAEALANELQLDLYRVDLSAVVSKWIGETEKNLRRLFDAAEESGVILLFDEADALFGKRGEVKDSHDRYANLEVSYLLQRMETYNGLAILTTNQKDILDPAFLRRIRFVVQFPFPDAVERAEIWKGIFPDGAPIEALDTAKLAQLNLAGGNIRNIALNAAFIAADAGQPVSMAHLLKAAQQEYLKMEKPLTGAETRGWNESPD